MMAEFAARRPRVPRIGRHRGRTNPSLRSLTLSARNTLAVPLRGGWYPWDPYQYRDYRRGVPVLTGFDVEIERALERILGVEILLPEIAWNAHLEALAAGTADIAAGATKSEARSAFAYFSKPYRSETDVLILRKGAAGRYAFSTIDEMLETFAKQKFRLGVVAGFVYADSRVNAFIADPAYKDLIVPTGAMPRISRTSSRASLTASLPTVSLRRPRLGASIWAHASRSIRCASPPIFISCSAAQPRHRRCWLASTQPSTSCSAAANFAVSPVYALPVLINQTLDSEWFRVLAFIGTIAFALSGVVLAYAGQYSLFGALILASLPALGGGVVRDLLLQRDPLGIVRNPEALLIVFATVLAGMVVIKTVSQVRTPPLAEYVQSHARLGPVDRGIRCRRTCRLHRRRRRGRGGHVGQAALAVGSDRRRPHRLVRRPDAGHAPPRPVVADLRGELYPEIATVLGLAFAIFLEWEEHASSRKRSGWA